jgi:hypothetical protein
VTPFDELRAVLGTMEFETDGWLQLLDARETTDGLQATLGAFLGGGAPRQRWEIKAHRVSRARLSLIEPLYEVYLADDHPLLWPHARDVASLSFFFREGVEEPLAVAAVLYEHHREITDDWLPFEDFVNASAQAPLSVRIARRHGVLAEGPVALLEAYAGVLEGHGAVTNLFSPRPPMRWDGARWVEEPEGLSACVLGESYIVACRFEVARVG